MTKAAFKPFSIVTGLLAGIVAAKLFERVWSLISHEEAPDPKHRETDWRKLVPALAVEGAIARVVRGAAEHGTRVAYKKTVGTWPGPESAAAEREAKAA